MLTGRFVLGDVCSFKVAIPTTADLNDHMFLRIEYLNNVKMSILKAPELEQPHAVYEFVRAGQTFSATQNVNFFLIMESLSHSRGQFVFSVWYKDVPGAGKQSARGVRKPVE